MNKEPLLPSSLPPSFFNQKTLTSPSLSSAIQGSAMCRIISSARSLYACAQRVGGGIRW